MSTASVTVRAPPAPVPVGRGIPADVPHAVSVSLPAWQDNIDYEEGRLASTMETGYPRFFIHRSIKKLAEHVEGRFAKPHEACLLVPTARVADRCRDFLQQHDAADSVRIVQFCLVPPGAASTLGDPCSAPDKVSVYIVLFARERFALAKSFWQHTGDGISSRMAERCLRILEDTGKLAPADAAPQQQLQQQPPQSPVWPTARNRHYARGRSTDNGAASLANSIVSLKTTDDNDEERVTPEHSIYVEERYGRNLPLSSAALAKQALRRRIAGTLLADRDVERSADTPLDEDAATKQAAETSRAGTSLTDDDVYLYPTGMSAIFHAHQIVMLDRRTAGEPVGKSICFGFPYTDTLKILQKWGPGCHHFGHGTDAELDELEQLLASGERILALFCEFPSNPLLRSPDLARLRGLADKHDFDVVIDETIGNFVNVEVLPYADLVVSSLTKVFSGDTNVMGGSLVLNPHSPRAARLRKAIAADYEDMYWGEDAIFLERNSRDFIPRIQRVNDNTDALCELLVAETRRPAAERVVTKVQYPKFETRHHYDACRRKQSLVGSSRQERQPGGGYGGLFSIFFPSEEVASTFYDALHCAKGPSLGTNFTLASPYAILAHYTELDWAAQFGVERTLIRISVGLEPEKDLLLMFTTALDAARKRL